MFSELEIEKQFTPGSRDKRVGWVRASLRDNDLIAIDVVTANVMDDDGVEVGRRNFRDEADSTPRFSEPYQRGLGRVAAFSAMISQEPHTQYEQGFIYIPEGMSYPLGTASADELLGRGTGDLVRHTDAVEKVWAETPGELLTVLQQELAKFGFEAAYETMYYWINGAIKREYPAESALTNVSTNMLLLPDAAMADRTTNQSELIRTIYKKLNNSLINDQTMRSRITGEINDVSVEKLPERFIVSRKRAAANESEIAEILNQLVIKRLAYTPVGHGRAGRSWPYMDATEPDPDKSYGPELATLHRHETGRPMAELNREIKELHARTELAREALDRFELLNRLERQA